MPLVETPVATGAALDEATTDELTEDTGDETAVAKVVNAGAEEEKPPKETDETEAGADDEKPPKETDETEVGATDDPPKPPACEDFWKKPAGESEAEADEADVTEEVVVTAAAALDGVVLATDEATAAAEVEKALKLCSKA